MDNWTIDVDAQGTAVIWFNVPGRAVNTLSESAIREFHDVVARIAEDPAIRSAVIASGKANTFCSGAELQNIDSLAGPVSPDIETRSFAEDFARFSSGHAVFRRLETCGKPVACAIDGAALGGGAELALACHYRVATATTTIGFPEIAIGLMPGGGATQRLPRLIGVAAALRLLLSAKTLNANDALKSGLFDAVVDPVDLLAAATAWLRGPADPSQPWDRKGATVPGGSAYAAGVSDIIAGTTAMTSKQKFGNYPAETNLLSAVYEGVQVPFDAGLRIECRYFIRTLRSPQAKAMIRSLFLSPKALKDGVRRPANTAPITFDKVSVIGAGLMGAGIAYVQAAAGIETVLLDRTQEAADKGKEYARKTAAKAVGRGFMTQRMADELLARIQPTTEYSLIAGSALAIEAVFEDRAVKAEVTSQAERWLEANAIMATNTSTLPISGLAHASRRPANFIGLHFFSPVDRMGLVEIIQGVATGTHALAGALDYVARIGKTPIVVQDSRGFYTSRTITQYSEEPCAMLLEGIAPAIIENLGKMTGMPMGPFELADFAGLDLALHVREQTAADLGTSFKPTATDAVLRALVVGNARLGRKNGRGFYDYSEDGKEKRLWPGLQKLAAVTRVDAFDKGFQQEIKNRLLYSMALQAAWCMDEKIMADPREADVGALLAFGFPSWTGGPLSLIDMIGIRKFVAECDRMAAAYGKRFLPPNLLRAMAARNEGFYDAIAA